MCDQWAPVGDYEEDDAEQVPMVSVYRQHDIPERYHWRGARNIAPIVLITRPGVILLTVGVLSFRLSSYGSIIFFNIQALNCYFEFILASTAVIGRQRVVWTRSEDAQRLGQ